MKVVFLMGSFGGGGSERTVAYLSKYMSEQGHDVTVLCLTDEIFYELGEKVKLKTLHIPSQPKNAVDRYVKIAKRFLKTRRALNQMKPDVVFCMLPFAAKFILGHKKRGGYRLISSERALPQAYDEATVNLILRVFRECDGVIFQTQRAKDFFPEDIQSKGVVIHNAVGNPLVQNAPTAVVRQKKIAAMGRVTSQKDYPTLLRAFAEVAKAYPEHTLEIYGEGPDEAALQSLAEELGIGSRVLFQGAHPDAILRIADSACYVMSSRYEGMPNALMEAMAVGLPCISTDCPNGPAELIEDGRNGLLVPVGDVEAMSGAILRYLGDPSFSEACGREAREILHTHAIDVKAKEYVEFIEQIIHQ